MTPVPAPATAPDSLHRRLAAVLTVGTAVAVATVAVGFVVALASGSLHDPQPLRDVLAAGNAASIVAVGLLILTLVPPVLLAVAALAFWRRREQRYALLSSLVLGLLLVGLIAALSAAPVGG